MSLTAIRARLEALQGADQRWRDDAAARLTARCRTGHVEATDTGLRIVTNVRGGPFFSDEWAGEIMAAGRDAIGGER